MVDINTDVVNIDLERDEGIACTPVAFTNAAIDDVETLTFVPTRPGKKLVVIINNIAADAGALAVTVAAGNYWYAKALAAVSIAAEVSKAFCFTPARYQTSTGLKATSGKIVITITPAAGKKVWTDHDATYQHFQLPGVVGRLPSESES